MRAGLKRQVGNGCAIRFWKDPWVVDVPLLSMCSNSPPDVWMDLRVCDF